MILRSKATLIWLRAAAGGLALAAAVFIGACGGSTTQVDPFVAQRVFAFGDESSLLLADGRRYGVNGLDTSVEPHAFNCNLNPLWVQVIASNYGFVFAECNLTVPAIEPKAFMRATLGATVADVAVQLQRQVEDGGFRDKDLALVLAGANDVLELYRRYPAVPEETLIADARARGERMAAVVNRMISLGAKVIVSNLADMGLSPFASREALENVSSGFNRAALISRITSAFNEGLAVKLLLDGRYVGLVQMDLRTQSAARSPGSFGFANVSIPICTVDLPDCNTDTLITGVVASSYLWADDTRLAPGGQTQLIELGLQRAQNNPF